MVEGTELQESFTLVLTIRTQWTYSRSSKLRFLGRQPLYCFITNSGSVTLSSYIYIYIYIYATGSRRIKMAAERQEDFNKQWFSNGLAMV